MADTLDLLSLAEAKAALSIGSTDTRQNDNLTRAITAVTRRLDGLVGPIVQRTVTNERHNGGLVAIELRKSPATSITTLTEYDSAGGSTSLTEETESTKPADAWLGDRYDPDPDLYSGFLIRRTSGADAFFEPGRANVLVTYVAGRYANTAAVDERFKEAAAITLRNMWRSYQESVGQFNEYEVPQQNFPTFAVPKAAMELLHDVVQPEVGF